MDGNSELDMLMKRMKERSKKIQMNAPPAVPSHQEGQIERLETSIVEKASKPTKAVRPFMQSQPAEEVDKDNAAVDVSDDTLPYVEDSPEELSAMAGFGAPTLTHYDTQHFPTGGYFPESLTMKRRKEIEKRRKVQPLRPVTLNPGEIFDEDVLNAQIVNMEFEEEEEEEYKAYCARFEAAGRPATLQERNGTSSWKRRIPPFTQPSISNNSNKKPKMDQPTSSTRVVEPYESEEEAECEKANSNDSFEFETEERSNFFDPNIHFLSKATNYKFFPSNFRYFHNLPPQ